MLSLDIEITSVRAVATYPAGATYGPRHLHDFEFVWIIEGDTEYRRNDITYPAPPGAIVLCRPEATDFFRWDARRRTRHAYFHFHLHGTPPDDWPQRDSWPTVRVPARSDDLLPTLFRHVLTDPHRADSLQTRLLALSLLSAFVTGETGDGAVEATRLPEPVERAMAHLARRLDAAPADPLPLSELAEAACVTPEHLCRLFKSATGHTPAETVRLARLDRAVMLLSRTNWTVGEVARLCGFESQFHFARLFKKAFGYPPSELRRLLTETGHMPNTRLLQIATTVNPVYEAVESNK